MKLRLYKLLFCIFSFLSDKTNGTHFFVKYKLFLGTIIIGLTGVACSSKSTPPQIMCYEPVVPDTITIIEDDYDTLPAPNVLVTCYDITENQEDSSKTEKE